MHDVPAAGPVIGALDGDGLFVLLVLAPATELDVGAVLGRVEHQGRLGRGRRLCCGRRVLGLLGGELFGDQLVERLERSLLHDLLDDLFRELLGCDLGQCLRHLFCDLLNDLVLGRLHDGLVLRGDLFDHVLGRRRVHRLLLRRCLGFVALRDAGLLGVLLVARDRELLFCF